MSGDPLGSSVLAFIACCGDFRQKRDTHSLIKSGDLRDLFLQTLQRVSVVSTAPITFAIADRLEDLYTSYLIIAFALLIWSTSQSKSHSICIRITSDVRNCLTVLYGL
jgi:hypothetical protein